jgi:hypothetical protein
LQAKLLGDLDERPVVNVMLSPDWYAMSAAVERALAPYGLQARLDVAAALYGTARAQQQQQESVGSVYASLN